jgi:hypothetical protein
VGGVLVCFSCLSLLFYGIQVSAHVGRIRRQLRPVKVQIAKDIQENLAEFQSPKWVAENIPVANVSVNCEEFLVLHDCRGIVNREIILPMERQLWEGERSAARNNLLLKRHTSRYPAINRCFWQLLAGHIERPRPQKGRRLSPILDGNLELWPPEKSEVARNVYRPNSKLRNFQHWKGHASGNIRANLGSLGIYDGGTRSYESGLLRTLEFRRLLFHLPKLALHGLPLTPHEMPRLSHFVPLSSHLVGLTAINQPSEEHYNQLQNSDNGQRPFHSGTIVRACVCRFGAMPFAPMSMPLNRYSRGRRGRGECARALGTRRARDRGVKVCRGLRPAESACLISPCSPSMSRQLRFVECRLPPRRHDVRPLAPRASAPRVDSGFGSENISLVGAASAPSAFPLPVSPAMIALFGSVS